MTNFAILRTGKIKGRAHLKASHNHNATPDHRPGHADAKKPPEIVAGDANALDAFNNLVDKHNCTVRKNAVVALEFVCSFTPEAGKHINLDQWVSDTTEFFKQKYGADNLLQAALHTDEKTPHMHILVAPLVEKQHKKGVKTTLSARDLTGGQKGPEKLEKLQDEYAAAVAHHGLERGIKGSTTKNIPLRELAAESAHFVKQAERFVESKGIPYQNPRKSPGKKKGFLGVNWEKSYEHAAQRCATLKKQLNKALDALTALQVLNKQLEREKSRLKARVADLEGLRGVHDLEGENKALKDENKVLHEHVAQQSVELESWRLGGQGKPLSPAMRQGLERQREAEVWREKPSRGDHFNP